MKSQYTFESLKDHYSKLIPDAKITQEPTVLSVARRIVQNKERYLAVQKKTDLPWYLIGAIHNKEASGRFDRNLCNGQPLNMVTTIVPKHRGPYKTWEASAIDAIGLQKRIQNELDTHNGWSLEECLYYSERYNGLGYRKHNINSPYLWACTSNYTRGGYPSDGKYDPNHLVKNPGVFPIIFMIEKIEGSLNQENRDLEVKLTWDEKTELHGEVM